MFNCFTSNFTASMYAYISFRGEAITDLFHWTRSFSVGVISCSGINEKNDAVRPTATGAPRTPSGIRIWRWSCSVRLEIAEWRAKEVCNWILARRQPSILRKGGFDCNTWGRTGLSVTARKSGRTELERGVKRGKKEKIELGKEEGEKMKRNGGGNMFVWKIE